jgi:hypothetical protein
MTHIFEVILQAVGVVSVATLAITFLFIICNSRDIDDERDY